MSEPVTVMSFTIAVFHSADSKTPKAISEIELQGQLHLSRCV